ncbi:transglutaminase-like domain-containing protein [Undibacterium sp. Di24W]|uniref:transglutaminase-like domain-containing protein n=1 Tax=Undibacterium sp. Di24W TaxID=3413033 RepID=UPI003BF2B7EC
MQRFLESSKYIDWKSESILQKAAQLRRENHSELALVKACFEFVRDEIRHSLDYQLNPVTCKASDVLKEGTGFCFAKSHLLAALLRANDIPTALIYQRIAFGEAKTSFYLHGLNAVYLHDFGWHHIDPRGLKKDLKSDFSPPQETLPFTPRYEGEVIYEERWSEPSANITSLLEGATSYLSVIERLPLISL